MRTPRKERATPPLVVLIALVFLTVHSAEAAPDIRQIVVEHRLANGMKFLLVRRETAPVFTAYIRVKAGGADERAGKTGLAHLFEHLAYKGTATVGSRNWQQEEGLLSAIAQAGDDLAAAAPSSPKAGLLKKRIDELSAQARTLERENALTEILTRNGGSDLNAETDKDLTTFYVSLPANRIELWALLEASRLAAPVPRDFYAERSVVMEERRERIDSEPMGVMLEELSLLGFSTSPYRWPTVGFSADLESLSMRDALEFHREHYVPSNALGAIVGDIDIEATERLLDRTFGAIPARPAPRPISATEPRRRSERRSTVFFDASPRLAVGFLKPTLPDRDDYVFDVIELLMTDGRTSRLYRALVTDQAVCSEVSSIMVPGARLPHLYALIATPLANVPLEKVEAALLAELERLKTNPVDERELARVRVKLDVDFSRQISTNAGLADSLSFFEAIAGDWRYMADHRRQIASITAADVQRVARAYFVSENRVVVSLRRPPGAGTEEERP